MKSFLLRSYIEMADAFRYSRLLRNLVARALAFTAPRAREANPPSHVVRAVGRLCRAATLSSSQSLTLRIERQINRHLSVLEGRTVDWREVLPNCAASRLEKAVILKPHISARERGVVLVSFEEQWLRLLRIRDLREFADRYILVCAPSWSPPHALATSLFPAVYPRRFFSLISDESDLQELPRISPKIVTVPLYASNWVNPGLFRPLSGGKKDIDIVMLANFAPYKRHFALFAALRNMPRQLRVRLIGQDVLRWTADGVKRQAKLYGVEDRFELLVNASEEELYDSFARARISIILSLHEGSCVAVVESMFSDTPVGILAGAKIGSRAFINSQTGRFLPGSDLSRELTRFVEEAANYQPRRWVAENRVDCYGSTETLDRCLREQALAEGEEWTTPIAVHHWRPNPELLSPEDRERMVPAYEDIHSRFGIRIG